MVNCTGEVMAQHVFDVLSDYDSLESIKALLMDIFRKYRMKKMALL